MSKYIALKATVKNRGTPPDSFLDELISWARTAPDEIFVPNNEQYDVMTRLKPLLGSHVDTDAEGDPIYVWDNLQHRKAALLELLRCLAGFESSWNWNEGVDKTNQTSMHNIEGQETGIFQVSHDSLRLDKSGTLKQWLSKHLETAVNNAQEFIDAMKSYHSFAIEYAARLLRISYKWDGPILRHEIDSSLSRAAVQEFISLIS